MHIRAEELTNALSARGHRITAARQAVCEVIATSHDRHLTAAGIYDLTRAQTRTRLDRSTVYRTLDALEDAGLLVHSHLGHGPAVYHLADDAGHQHLICSSCGKTLVLPEEVAESLVESVTDSVGFVPDVSHFALSGLCADCLAVERDRS
jgi:Fur family transcriptional regulator, ferric uptake regulator